MKKTVIALGLALSLTGGRAQAFDPMSVYKQESTKGCPAASVQSGKLELNDLIQIGICNNPDLRRGFMAVRSSEAAVGEAKSAYLPKIDLTAVMSAADYRGEYDEPTANVYKKMKQKPYAVNVALNWLLLDFGGRSAGTEAMTDYMRAAAFGYNAALHDITLGITGAYLDLLSAQEVLKSAETSVASYKKSYDETQKKYQVGKAVTSDLLLAKTTYLRSKLAVTAAKNTIEKNQANLARLLNLPPETDFKLVAPKKDKTTISLQQKMTVRKMIETALALRPELKSAEANASAAKKAITAAKSSMAPTLSLTGTVGYADRWKDDKPLQDGYPYTYGGEVGLALNVPLFQGFSKMYGVAKARYDYQQAVYSKKAPKTP